MLGEEQVMAPKEKTEEVRDVRAELKALCSIGIWNQFTEDCDEKTILRRRRWAYLDDRLNLLINPKANPQLSVVLKRKNKL